MSKPGTMSRDRVEFTLGSYAAGRARTKYEKALVACLGLSHNEVRDVLTRAGNGYGVKVRCRPSQFARLLIMRNDLGCANEFRAMDPKLVDQPVVDFIDVSTRPASQSLCEPED